ncbi:MAG: hypothetical protein QG577_251 [Thermodesulfobacteriota bacterium]|nr:hypothetical protein [Thermodesulfobacteriota bacterium]
MRIGIRICCVAILMVMIFPGQAQSSNRVDLSKGQTVYVSVYSHIYGGPRTRSLDLTATLSIRNTDPTESLELTSVRYFDSEGKLVRKYLEKPQAIGPLATTRFIVEEYDTAGGSGAKFLVGWRSLKPVTPPVIECIMITIQSGLGISFVSHGRVIRDVGQ